MLINLQRFKDTWNS